VQRSQAERHWVEIGVNQHGELREGLGSGGSPTDDAFSSNGLGDTKHCVQLV
jgi:hypothetical protein